MSANKKSTKAAKSFKVRTNLKSGFLSKIFYKDENCLWRLKFKRG